MSFTFECLSPIVATSTLKTSLISFWEFEDSGSPPASFLDSVATGNTLSPHGTPNPPTAAGLVGNGLSITGANGQYLDIASNSSLQVGSSDFSLQAWFKASNPDGTLISKQSGFGNAEYMLYCGFVGGAAGRVALFDVMTNSGASINTVTGTVTVNGGSSIWYHVVATYATGSGAMLLYVNAGTPDSATAANRPVVNSTATFNIGHDPRGNAANFGTGIIDQVGIWKKVLSASEITQLYNSGAGLSYAAM